LPAPGAPPMPTGATAPSPATDAGVSAVADA
jgi:hypothetical protein